MSSTHEAQIVAAAARKYGIPASILWGVYGTETNFGRNTSTSSAGAVGPFQFEPETARSLGIDPHDFKQAAFGAAKYLSQFKGRGEAGMLSAYNAGPAGAIQPGYVASVRRNAKTFPRGVSGSPGGGGTPQDSLSVLLRQGTGQQAVQPADTTAVDQLAQGLQKPMPAPLGYLPDPQHTARQNIPYPQQAPQLPYVSQPIPQGPNLNDQLQAVSQIAASQPQQQQQQVTLSGAVHGAQAADAQHAGHYPLAKRGKIIGTPYTGTHTLGNWQSDNAVDISAAVGTPVYAASSGVVSKAGSLGAAAGSRFAGDRVQLDGVHNSFWYGHLSKLTVHAGQKVHVGELLGYSGSANGVAHLHFAQHRGDPRRTVR